jgi:hypothetical protein
MSSFPADTALLFREDAGTKEKALVIAAFARQQQSALDLCAFCRWTAARLAAVRVPPSPTVDR